MATEADASFTEKISAEVVGRAFVSQFYEILHHEPELVYRFYNNSSTMSRPDPSGDLVTVSAMEGIKDLFLSLDCKSNKAEIFTADTQASHMDGVTVLVTGCLTGQDNVRRKFAESFFLAPQDGGFFVLNDTFRFMVDDSLPVKESVEEHCDKSAPAAPESTVALVKETAEVVDNSLENHVAPLKEIVETTTVPVVQRESTQIEKAVPTPVLDSSYDVPAVVEALSNGDVDAPKKSYASLLMNGKQGGSAFPVHVPTAAKPVKRNVAPKAVPRVGQQAQAATVPAAAVPTAASEISSANGSNGNASSNGHATSNGHVAAKGYSVYIGQLPYDATVELVDREFKKFGRIKKNGIQVRSNKGYVFGFVEYEDASAQANAINQGAIQISGREVFIEEKRTAARADDYPSGRGGYRNDGFRRGGNYSNGRGYARNDYGKRNGEGPAHGRGNGDGYVHQNGGGRGDRQGAPK